MFYSLLAVIAENPETNPLSLFWKIFGLLLVGAVVIFICFSKKHDSSENPDDDPPPIVKPPEIPNPNAPRTYEIVIFNNTKKLLRFYLRDGSAGSKSSEKCDHFISPGCYTSYDMDFEQSEIIVCDLTGRKTYFQKENFYGSLPCCDKGFAIILSCDNTDNIVVELITVTHVPPLPFGDEL